MHSHCEKVLIQTSFSALTTVKLIGYSLIFATKTAAPRSKYSLSRAICLKSASTRFCILLRSFL